MKATVVDMKRNPKKIIAAIERHETITLSKGGKLLARIEPVESEKVHCVDTHPAFGIWKDREDMADPATYVRGLRTGRFNAL